MSDAPERKSFFRDLIQPGLLDFWLRPVGLLIIVVVALVVFFAASQCATG